MTEPFAIAKTTAGRDLLFQPALANRQGLITGATGTGKTVTLVRLIRSKGVGVYFITQSPSDIPGTVLGQLSHRVQHALRAFTPYDQKAVKTAADTLRPNPAINASRVITELSVGEALVSLLDAKGSPEVTERAWILPPASQIGPIADAARDAIRREGAALYGQYDQPEDRQSAYEQLKARTAAKDGGAAGGQGAGTGMLSTPPAGADWAGTLAGVLLGTTGPRGGRHEGLLESAAKSAARSVGSNVGRAIIRGALGSILGGSARRR